MNNGCKLNEQSGLWETQNRHFVLSGSLALFSFAFLHHSRVHLSWTSFNCHFVWVINMFLSLCVCFPRRAEAFLCHKADTLTMTKKLLEYVFPTWGMPSKISSNWGKVHWANHMKLNGQPCKLLGIWLDPITLSYQARLREKLFKQNKLNYTGLNELMRRVTIL